MIDQFEEAKKWLKAHPGKSWSDYLQALTAEVAEESNQPAKKKERIFTPEHRQKLAAAKIGDKNIAKRSDVREKISEALTGHVLSDDTKRKISEAHKGRVQTEEHRRKNSEAQLKRQEEIRRTGRPVGYVASDETRRKMSEAHKGRPQTEEHRRKIVEAQLKRHAQNKEQRELAAKQKLLKRKQKEEIRAQKKRENEAKKNRFRGLWMWAYDGPEIRA